MSVHPNKGKAMTELNTILVALIEHNLVSLKKLDVINRDIQSSKVMVDYWIKALTPLYTAVND
jgi:hypothetical protein